MSHWNDICCAIDFSEPSRAALERAVELADRLDARLTLLHVCAPAFPGAEAVFGAGKPQEGLSEGPVQAQLDVWRSEAERTLGRSVRVEILFGNPAREIARFGSRAADMLVVGTRGPTGLGRLLLGSVAERVVRDAACPVLVVHQPPAVSDAAELGPPP
jgi:nucleotide-binding universal stress UspA family protein